MRYTSSLPFRGDIEQALSLAASTLTGTGFRLTGRTIDSVALIGPGMKSVRQSPLLGASRIYIWQTPGQLVIEAELGGVTWMSRFVIWFPIGLILGLGILLTLAFHLTVGIGTWIATVAAVVGGSAAFWLLIGLLLAVWIRLRTTRAIDVLLANIVNAGEYTERAALIDRPRP